MSDQITLLQVTLMLREMLLEAYDKEDVEAVQDLRYTFHTLTEAIGRISRGEAQGGFTNDKLRAIYTAFDALDYAAQHGSMFKAKRWFKSEPPTIEQLERAFSEGYNIP